MITTHDSNSLPLHLVPSNNIPPPPPPHPADLHRSLRTFPPTTTRAVKAVLVLREVPTDTTVVAANNASDDGPRRALPRDLLCLRHVLLRLLRDLLRLHPPVRAVVHRQIVADLLPIIIAAAGPPLVPTNASDPPSLLRQQMLPRPCETESQMHPRRSDIATSARVRKFIAAAERKEVVAIIRAL